MTNKMCGIYFYIGPELDLQKHFAAFQKIQHRGPDSSVFRWWRINDLYVILGFHRLAIMDTSEYGEQPIVSKSTVVLANAEIWNYKEINALTRNNAKGSDCRAILNAWDFQNNPGENSHKPMYELLDGEYAYIILDEAREILYWSVDELSVRPLFVQSNKKSLCFCSEPRALFNPVRVKPASYNFITLDNLQKNQNYTSEIYYNWQPMISDISYEKTRENIYMCLAAGMAKRIRSDREMAFFLSGGLDSSIVSALAINLIRQENPNLQIKTFTIGLGTLNNVPDILAARLVAQHLQTDHHELRFSWQTAINAIPDVVKTLESADETTVRASVPMWLAARYISEHFPDIKVIFSGEIADEMFRGYQYNHRAPSAQAGREDTVRLLQDVHHFDGLRADRCLARFGIELRLPFANKQLLDLVLSSDPKYYNPYNNIEKYILRDAIAVHNPNLLPDKILWRSKQALSDATSVNSSWKELIKSKIPEDYENESAWYASMLKCKSTVPYKWMPAWVNVQDSSATALPFYIKDTFTTLQ